MHNKMHADCRLALNPRTTTYSYSKRRLFLFFFSSHTLPPVRSTLRCAASQPSRREILDKINKQRKKTMLARSLASKFPGHTYLLSGHRNPIRNIISNKQQTKSFIRQKSQKLLHIDTKPTQFSLLSFAPDTATPKTPYRCCALFSLCLAYLLLRLTSSR